MSELLIWSNWQHWSDYVEVAFALIYCALVLASVVAGPMLWMWEGMKLIREERRTDDRAY